MLFVTAYTGAVVEVAKNKQNRRFNHANTKGPRHDKESKGVAVFAVSL
jgi:hypothetical protein